MSLLVGAGLVWRGKSVHARREQGLSITEALVAAGQIRRRPILMTTTAMVFGMLPLAPALEEGPMAL